MGRSEAEFSEGEFPKHQMTGETGVESCNSEAPFLRLIFELTLAVLATLFISSLITPVIFVLIAHYAGEVLWPYSRVFDRVILVFLVLFVVLRAKHFQLGSYVSSFPKFIAPPRLVPIGMGLLLTISASALALPFIVGDGELLWSTFTGSAVLFRVAEVLPAALLIALLEEVFFRFFLFLSLRRYMHWIFAAIFSSAIYAVVHFIQPVKSWSFDEINVLTGFYYLLELGGRIFQAGVPEAVFGLFLVGLVLCLTVEKSNSILLAIGMHAGWVVTTKTVGQLVANVPGFEYPIGVGRRYFLLTESETWVSILIVGLVAYFFISWQQARSLNGGASK